MTPPLGASQRARSLPYLPDVRRAGSCTIGVALCSLACSGAPSAPEPHGPPRPEGPTGEVLVTDPAPVAAGDYDHEATLAAAERLRQTLAALTQDSLFALGHEDSTAYGVGWAEDVDRSDIKSVCGSHPAVYGWDLFHIEHGAPENGDGVNFDLMRQRIQEAHARGGINTLSWHVDNPVSQGDAWDTTRAVAASIPGGTHHAVFRDYLDRVANFLLSCRGNNGELVPVIFRPFHEHNGNWFWWGRGHTNDDDYVALWRFTVDYLREARGLTHVLFAFSPGGGELKAPADYLFRYPGDDYVDVMGVDHYYDTDVASLTRAVAITVQNAIEHGKVPALTEFGMRDGLTEMTPADWFSRNFFDPLIDDANTSRIAYALAWRNARPDHCFVPYPGHQTADDFKRICDDGRLLLQRDLPLTSHSSP